MIYAKFADNFMQSLKASKVLFYNYLLLLNILLNGIFDPKWHHPCLSSLWR